MRLNEYLVIFEGGKETNVFAHTFPQAITNAREVLNIGTKVKVATCRLLRCFGD